MHWYIKTKCRGKPGDLRKTKKFAWFPTIVQDNQRVWLEFYYYVEKCHSLDSLYELHDSMDDSIEIDEDEERWWIWQHNERIHESNKRENQSLG